MVGMYSLAGALHLTIADEFVTIMPTWIPAPHAMVIFTGWCELYGHVLGWGISGTRLALQPVLVWWSLFCAGVVNWPFENSTNASRV
jgi:uncharacterized membrane protein